MVWGGVKVLILCELYGMHNNLTSRDGEVSSVICAAWRNIRHNIYVAKVRKDLQVRKFFVFAALMLLVRCAHVKGFTLKVTRERLRVVS